MDRQTVILSAIFAVSEVFAKVYARDWLRVLKGPRHLRGAYGLGSNDLMSHTSGK